MNSGIQTDAFVGSPVAGETLDSSEECSADGFVPAGEIVASGSSGIMDGCGVSALLFAIKNGQISSDCPVSVSGNIMTPVCGGSCRDNNRKASAEEFHPAV